MFAMFPDMIEHTNTDFKTLFA